MNETTNSNAKLIRIVLASTVGALLWAGCAQPRMAVVDSDAIAHAPIDLTNRRPDTHPEQRNGIWRTTSLTTSPVTVATPNVRPPEAPSDSIDSSSLLSYNPEVINAVPPGSEGAIVIEAAGAERPQRRTWRERWIRRNTAPTTIREERREIIIQPEGNVQPQPEASRGTYERLDETNGEKLAESYFVEKE